MKITSSYGAEILYCHTYLIDTIKIYREAVSFLIDVVIKEWTVIGKISSSKLQLTEVEMLTHSTSNRIAKYDFDKRFYKFPSYFRRSAINTAIGIVSSYKSNYEIWENNGKVGKPPRLETVHRCMPTFYKGNMYNKIDDECYSVQVKLYIRNDWIWHTIQLKKTDMDYITKYWSHCTPSSPTLVRKHKKFFLRYAFEEETKLSNTPIDEQTICAVDLGINTDATCSIMNAKGTVIARKFINFPIEKDHLYTVLNRIKKFQRKHGSKNVKGFWRYASNINDEIAKKVANSIVSFAAEYGCDVIVFEYLDIKGKKRGGKKQKLALWKKDSIQNYVEHKAHRVGMRISRVNPWGTSKYAFDGSGKVERNKDNHSLCTFTTGKKYNCDLSASYNIGARYFIRGYLSQPSLAKEVSVIVAKVPQLQRRTCCVFSDFKELLKVI